MKIEVRLSEKEFLSFSLFDAFIRGKHWRGPALFVAILGAAAGACFLARDRRGAVLLGCVLLAVALGLPGAYLLSFFLSARRRAREEGLGSGKRIYTLELHDGGRGIVVDNGQEHAVYPWEQVFRAYRRAGATYLYITPQRAFLIPHSCVGQGEEALWALLERRVPADRRA